MSSPAPAPARVDCLLLLAAADSLLPDEGRALDGMGSGGIDRARSRSRSFQTLSFALRVSMQPLFRRKSRQKGEAEYVSGDPKKKNK